MILFITRLFRSRFYKVIGESMIPAFNNGDHVLAELLTDPIKQLRRGDVVVLKRPYGPSVAKRDLKRVVGLPGEYIYLQDGHVYINDVLLFEPWISVGQRASTQGIKWITGPNEYWLLGDNRAHSTDSSRYGPVQQDMALARIRLRYWPISIRKMF